MLVILMEFKCLVKAVIAAVPELMGLKATVVSINNTTHSYLCGGCANNHLADVRIALKTLTWSFISMT
jgi:predicted SprT family Zn-dependent metalloprotease